MLVLLLLLHVLAVAATRDGAELPTWDMNLTASADTATYFEDGDGAVKGQVWLWWDVSSQAFRVDQRIGDSQLVSSTLVQYATRLAFVTSPNSSSLCSVFCLPPQTSALPVLRVAPNNTQGTTVPLGGGRWLRRTQVGVGGSRLGQYNASAVTQLRADGSPAWVAANYTLAGRPVARHTCAFSSFAAPVRVDPALLLPPPACLGLQPSRCFAPLAPDPFAVAQGCFFAEALPPFGSEPLDGCSCD